MTYSLGSKRVLIVTDSLWPQAPLSQLTVRRIVCHRTPVTFGGWVGRGGTNNLKSVSPSGRDAIMVIQLNETENLKSKSLRESWSRLGLGLWLEGSERERESVNISLCQKQAGAHNSLKCRPACLHICQLISAETKAPSLQGKGHLWGSKLAGSQQRDCAQQFKQRRMWIGLSSPYRIWRLLHISTSLDFRIEYWKVQPPQSTVEMEIDRRRRFLLSSPNQTF